MRAAAAAEHGMLNYLNHLDNLNHLNGMLNGFDEDRPPGLEPLKEPCLAAYMLPADAPGVAQAEEILLEGGVAAGQFITAFKREASESDVVHWPSFCRTHRERMNT